VLFATLGVSLRVRNSISREVLQTLKV
jgi:hypothetical protein